MANMIFVGRQGMYAKKKRKKKFLAIKKPEDKKIEKITENKTIPPTS